MHRGSKHVVQNAAAQRRQLGEKATKNEQLQTAESTHRIKHTAAQKQENLGASKTAKNSMALTLRVKNNGEEEGNNFPCELNDIDDKEPCKKKKK